MRVTVTGADGMLGKAVMTRLAAWDPVGLTEPRFKLERMDGVVEAITKTRPDWVVHTAAMTDVDGCEREAEAAYKINTLGTRNVALACSRCRAGLLYISTDFVFGGRGVDQPIQAWESPAPISVYGWSKWLSV